MVERVQRIEPTDDGVQLELFGIYGGTWAKYTYKAETR